MKKSEKIELLKKYINIKKESHNKDIATFMEMHEKQMSVAEAEIKRLKQIIHYLEQRIDNKTLSGAEMNDLHLVPYMAATNYDIVYNTLEKQFYIKSKTSDVMIGGFDTASKAIEMAETRVSSS